MQDNRAIVQAVRSISPADSSIGTALIRGLREQGITADATQAHEMFRSAVICGQVTIRQGMPFVTPEGLSALDQ